MTMSESTVCIKSLMWPRETTCFTLRNIPVSASSWPYGLRSVRSKASFELWVSSSVFETKSQSFSLNSEINFLLQYGKKMLLLKVSLNNTDRSFPLGISILSSIWFLLLDDTVLRSRHWVFRLALLYTSHTSSILVNVCIGIIESWRKASSVSQGTLKSN